MTAADAMLRWSPKDLVGRATEQDLNTFVVSMDAPYVLFISIGDPNSDLAKSLEEGKARKPEFQTEMVTGISVPSPFSGQQVSRTRAAPLPISQDLLQKHCYIVGLFRGAVEGQPRRMTVGRGSDNDIVLRDRSVSKVHGWIEADGFSHLCAGDANSTNHTHVNGTRLTTPVEVHPGCCIRFGSVETYLYRTQSLWQLLHAGAT